MQLIAIDRTVDDALHTEAQQSEQLVAFDRTVDDALSTGAQHKREHK